MKRILPFMILLLLILNSCKKGDETQSAVLNEGISNELNQFKDLSVPKSAKLDLQKEGGKSSLAATDNTGCTQVAHTQSAEFDKLSVLNPITESLYIGSLMDGASIQNGIYAPLFLTPDYVRKPITYSVSIQGSTGAISKTIIPSLSSFRNSMQEIMSSTIIGQQPANFTFELVSARSRKEIAMKLNANLSLGTFFKSVGDYNENNLSGKSYYLLKIFQKFFSADIDIPSDGNLFNKPTNFEGTVAPVYISSIDYGRSAFFLIESSYDSSRVYKSLEASFAVWKLKGGTTISKEQKDVMDEMKLSGTVIGGSSSDAVKTIGGLQTFHEYITNGGNLGPESRGEVIAYRLRNAKTHGIYKSIISGDYNTSDCSSQLAPVYQFYNSGNHYTTANRNAVDGFAGWSFEGVSFTAFKTKVPGAVPVHLFYQNPGFNHHISTDINAVSGAPNWTYQGISFYAYPIQMPGTIPIYLYYNHAAKKGDHFTTANPSLDPRYWTNYGVSFYAFPAN